MVLLALFGCPPLRTEPPPLLTDGVFASLTASEPVVCAAPTDRDTQGPFERRVASTPTPSDPWTWHGGIVAADLDNDGLLDVVSALEQGLDLYRVTEAGALVHHGPAVFGAFDLSFSSGASVVDYDADGDLDLYVTRVVDDPAPAGQRSLGVNRLLRNQGDGTFEDVTEEAGVGACGVDFRDGSTRCFRTMSSSWGDIDQDGDLDLYVGNYGFVDETPGTRQEDMASAERDFLYLNNGDGTFTDISDTVPIEVHEGYTYASGLIDLDADGDLDLYTVNDFGNRWPNRVMWNDNGTLVFDPQDASGLVRQGTGMGLGVGDLNGDGRPDLVIPEWKGNALLESRAEPGIWVDTASSRGYTLAGRQQVGWGTILSDVDNDGHLDIVHQYGHLASANTVWFNAERQPDALYLNVPTADGEFSFVEVGHNWGIADRGMSRGVVAADLNGDGWPDLAKRFLDGDSVIYLSRCGREAWLTVALEQPGTLNLDAVGARVELTAGGRTQTHEILAGGLGYGSAGPLVAHFGLGDADMVETLRVVWPDGAFSAFQGVAVRRQIVVTRWTP